MKPKIYKLCFLLFLTAICFITSCNTSIPEENKRSEAIKDQARAYFQTYAEREDWDQFLSYYAEDLQFEDAISQIHLDSLEAFKTFYDWPNPGFKKHPEYPEIFRLDDLVANDSIAVGRGVFFPFYWQDSLFSMEWDPTFTIWLWFDENLKINRQIDWVEYSGNVLIDIGKRIEEGDY